MVVRRVWITRLTAVRLSARPRVDGCMVDGRFVLVELEMLEPDLFFNLAPAAAARFAEALCSG
jgi:hypothetical protein